MIKLVHVVYRFDVGGLENILVQLINRLPRCEYQHALISLTDWGECARRIEAPNVELIGLNKGPGHAIPLYPALFQHFRRIRPDVVHTCNLAALEVVPVAWAAGVRRRIHAEHGWDASDPLGRNSKYQWLRRMYRPWVSHYVSVSQDLDRYLSNVIGVPDERRSLIANGVDTDVFSPRSAANSPAIAGCPFSSGEQWLVGTVGRLQTVKNQPLLAAAFARFLELVPEARLRARLILVGEGPLRPAIETILGDAGIRDLAWLPGTRSDVAAILRTLDVFVLPSQTEGTSCTLQEAMATGLPSVCTAVGGTPQLLSGGEHGILVPSDDVEAMAHALRTYWQQPELAARHATSARAAAVEQFALDAMVKQYDALFSARSRHENSSRS